MGRIDGAVQAIKRLIADGQLRPGDKLPIESELAEQLGVSKSSVREAVRALTTMRVLRTRQGDGTYVTSLEPELLLDAMNFIADLQQGSAVLHFFEVRRLLEPEATARAAQRIGAADLEELARLLDEAEQLASAPTVDHVRLVDNDHAFHSLINRACGNPVLSSVIANMSGQTLRVRIWRELTLEGVSLRTVAEHRAIYSALVDRDPERARLRSAVHVAGVEDWQRAALAAQAADALDDEA
ncbi:FadR/GntR family transcriptional regulator [Streptomyces sp. NPDC004752]